MSAKIIVIVAAIGLIVGLIQVSGVSGRLSLLLAQLSHGPWFLNLVVVVEDQTLPMATIAPSLGQAITMATFANIVSDNLDGVSIEVVGSGAATLHMMEVARGNRELSMASPVIYNLMSGGPAMYAHEPEAPQLAENIQLLMWFPYGRYHFTVRASRDIMTLDDVEGASVFLGAQRGGAFNAARGWVEATTGLVAGEDDKAITANWQTGFQTFLDGTIDVYVDGCLDPCGQFIQFTETEEIRFIGPEDHTGDSVEEFLGQRSGCGIRRQSAGPHDASSRRRADTIARSASSSNLTEWSPAGLHTSFWGPRQLWSGRRRVPSGTG